MPPGFPEFIPEGCSKIAQPFKVGCRRSKRPKSRRDSRNRSRTNANGRDPAVPSGLRGAKRSYPTLKGWAILTHPSGMKTCALLRVCILGLLRTEVRAPLRFCLLTHDVLRPARASQILVALLVLGGSKVQCFHRHRNHHPLSIPGFAAPEDERTPMVLTSYAPTCLRHRFSLSNSQPSDKLRP
jgi:hypothetical protein